MADGRPPAPTRRRWLGAARAPRGYQRHHLIPIGLLQRPQMAVLFEALRNEGFALRRFELNGLILPACERAAIECGHALHRGPHNGYSDVVAARVECVRAHFAVEAAVDPCAARRTAVMRLRLLQDATRRALTDRHRLGFWLNRRDPMRLFADRPYLDEAIERLFGA